MVGPEAVAHSTVVISPLARSSSRRVRGSTCEAVRWRELIVKAVCSGPVVGPGQEAVHFQVGEAAGVGERPGELGNPVDDTAEAAGDADSLRRERVEVCRGGLGGSGELRGRQVAGPGEVIDL